jgi:hypothetical protein
MEVSTKRDLRGLQMQAAAELRGNGEPNEAGQGDGEEDENSVLGIAGEPEDASGIVLAKKKDGKKERREAFRAVFTELGTVVAIAQCPVILMSGTVTEATEGTALSDLGLVGKFARVFEPMDPHYLTLNVNCMESSQPDIYIKEIAAAHRAHMAGTAKCPMLLIQADSRAGADEFLLALRDAVHDDNNAWSYMCSPLGLITAATDQEVTTYYMMQLRLGDDSAVRRIIVSTDKVSRGFDTSHLDGVLYLQPGHNIERVLQSLLRAGRYHRGQRLVVHVELVYNMTGVRRANPFLASALFAIREAAAYLADTEEQRRKPRWNTIHPLAQKVIEIQAELVKAAEEGANPELHRPLATIKQALTAALEARDLKLCVTIFLHYSSILTPFPHYIPNSTPHTYCATPAIPSITHPTPHNVPPIIKDNSTPFQVRAILLLRFGQSKVPQASRPNKLLHECCNLCAVMCHCAGPDKPCAARAPFWHAQAVIKRTWCPCLILRGLSVSL